MPRKEHAHRLRQGRCSEVGRTYSITAVLENRLPLFEDWKLGDILADEFRRAEVQGLVQSLAWVVMPDHFHWLVELRQGSLEKLLKQVKARSAIEINRSICSKGRIWQRGFHDRAVRFDDDLVDLARYIVANPLRAGLVQRLRDYPLWDAVWREKDNDL